MESDNWRLVICGLTHKSSSLEQRESLQLGTEELPGANAMFSGLSGVLESAILSTCNRIEFYFVTRRQIEPFDVVSRFYWKFKGLDVAPHRDLFDTKTGRDAADQLFRIAAGIDSMVIGESQILGQVKDAYSSACAAKSAGKVIHRLFHHSFRVGKRVRSETDIGKGACSVSSAVTEMLEDKLKAVGRPTVLFVGVSQMIRLAAKRLSRMSSCSFVFANRTLKKAQQLAAGFGAEGFGLDALTDLLTRADIVISCTSSDQPIIDQNTMTDVMDRRPTSRLLLVDMAIPRDIDVPKDWHPLVDVYDLEDVKRFVSDRQQQRQSAVPEAEEIIGRRLDEFDYWYQHVLLEPVYNGQTIVGVNAP